MGENQIITARSLEHLVQSLTQKIEAMDESMQDHVAQSQDKHAYILKCMHQQFATHEEQLQSIRRGLDDLHAKQLNDLSRNNSLLDSGPQGAPVMKHVLERLAKQEAELDKMRQTLATFLQQYGLTSSAGDASTPQETEGAIKSDGEHGIQTITTNSDVISSANSGAAVGPMRTIDSYLPEHFKIVDGMEVEYEWQESLWDAATFIGTRHMPPLLSFAVVLCLFFVVGFTLLCLLICAELLINQDFDEQSRSDFNVWRTTIAHDVHLQNRVSGQSLARAVCDRNNGIPYSSLQIDAVQTFYHYIGESFLPMGEVMCCLALCIWYLTLLIELRHVAHQVRAFSHVPIKQRTVLLPVSGDNSIHPQMQLVSVSVERLIFLACLILLRLIVVVTLVVIGTRYLCFETSPEDMLLNSVALILILELDELLYASVLPKVVQVYMKRMMPLTFPLNQKEGKVFCGLVLKVSLFVTLLCVAIISTLDPFVEELKANWKALCGGVDSSLDFVMTVDSIGIPWAAVTPNNDMEAITYDNYARSAVSHVMNNGFAQNHKPLAGTERSNTGYFMQVASGFALESLKITGQMFRDPKDWKVIGVEEAQAIVGWDEIRVFNDHDFGDAPNTVYNNYLTFLLRSSVSDTVNCSHVPAVSCHAHGSDAQHVVMRKLCPNRCGCHLPTSGSVSSPLSVSPRFGFMGCGPMNLRKPAFVKKLAELPCHDTNNIEDFASWVQGVGNAPSQKSSYGALSDELMASFQHGGCLDVVGVDLGAGTYAILCEESSLPAICPESCGCVTGRPWRVFHSQQKDYCPYSCNATQPPCITVSMNHETETGDSYLGGGYACMFPFKYKGIIYHSCTDVDWVGLWCAVTGRYGMTDYWGDCPDSC